MKKFLLILCLIAFTGCAYAAVDSDDYTTDENDTNYIRYEETTQEVEQPAQDTGKQKVEKKRKVRVGNPWRASSPNTYYNFGGTSGFKGRF